MNFRNKSEKWEITYVTPVYGGWDILVECKFNSLEDLDEIMALSDRITVMSRGKIAGMFDGGAAKREEIGLMIATGAPKT